MRASTRGGAPSLERDLSQLKANAASAAAKIDRFVHDAVAAEPIVAVGAAAGLGFLIGGGVSRASIKGLPESVRAWSAPGWQKNFSNVHPHRSENQMSNKVVRNSIGSLAEIANQAPHLYKMMSQLGAQRRRQRVARVARDAGWLGAGLVLGAGVVALLTPKTGTQIRRRISDQAHRVREYIKPTVNGAADRPIRSELS